MGQSDNITETAVRLQSVLLKTNVPTSVSILQEDRYYLLC